MRQLLEELTGKGKVLDGSTRISEVRYTVRIYQQYIESVTTQGGRALVPGLKEADMILSGCSHSIPMTQHRLTLVMEDGRMMNFFVIRAGVYQTTGGIFGP